MNKLFYPKTLVPGGYCTGFLATLMKFQNIQFNNFINVSRPVEFPLGIDTSHRICYKFVESDEKR